MKKMNRFQLTAAPGLLLALMAVAGVFGYGGVFPASAAPNPHGKLTIVTSLPLLKNIADQIGGDRVRVESIIHGPACDHEYEPGANDLRKLADCQIFIKVGMGSDPWADKLAKGILSRQARLIDTSARVQTMSVAGLLNPHYWGSPDNVKLMARHILDGLSAAKPEQKAYFTANYQRFSAAIDRTAAALKAKAAQVADRPFVSYSNAFPYFYQYFGFRNLRTVERSCEQEVSPRDLANAAKLMAERRIRVLIGDAAEPNEPDGLAQEVHATKLLLWPTTDESGDYLRTLRHNVELLVKALR